MKNLIFTAIAVLLVSCGASQASDSKLQSNQDASPVAEPATPSDQAVQPIVVGSSLRLASVCDSDLSVIKIYLGENFLQSKSLVLINLTLKNEALGIDAIVAAEGELTMNEAEEKFEYVLTHEGSEIARMNLAGEEGVPSRLVGSIDIEGWTGECK
jgi:hypothetical protein